MTEKNIVKSRTSFKPVHPWSDSKENKTELCGHLYDLREDYFYFHWRQQLSILLWQNQTTSFTSFSAGIGALESL